MREMSRLLDEVRSALGPAPRRLGILAGLRLRARPPHWLERTDALREVYRRQGMLLREADVVWGALVQANMNLFKPGPYDHPAMAVHFTDPPLEDDLGRLVSIGQRLFALKGTTPNDPSERRLAEMITDERERGMGWTGPKGCTGGRDVRSTTIMVIRRHLPGGVLISGWFPLLAHPETPAVMVVPCRYWPPDLVRVWSAGGEAT